MRAPFDSGESDREPARSAPLGSCWAVRSHPEAHVAGTAVGGVPRAGGAPVTPAVGVVAEVGAATRHPLPGRAVPEPVGGPLPDVAGRVVEAVPVRRTCVRRCRADESVFAPCCPGGTGPGTRSCGAPRSASARRPTGTDAVRDHRAPRTPTRPPTATGPAAERPCVEPGHVHHRVVGPADEAGRRPLGVQPRGAVDLAPPRCLRHRVRRGRRRATARRRRTTTPPAQWSSGTRWPR
jgi:hypothetical protein